MRRKLSERFTSEITVLYNKFASELRAKRFAFCALCRSYDITSAIEYRFSRICGKYEVYSNCPEEEKLYLYTFLSNGTENDKELAELYAELEKE